MRRIAVEFVGTALLLFVVVGSGISASSLGGDPVGMLVFHAVGVGLGLTSLVALFRGISGAHFNPAVTVAMLGRRTIEAKVAGGYLVAQLSGAFFGVLMAHASFGSALIGGGAVFDNSRGRIFAEVVVTFILVGIILGLVDQGRQAWVAPALGAWVTAAVLSSASGGFMNPAVTIARIGTDSYTGIDPGLAVGFVIAQFAAAALAVLFFGWIKSEPTKGN